MPRYYCDYCDTHLTHDSPSVRKQHCAGYKHKANVRQYYQQFEEQQTQTLIDQKVKEHLAQRQQDGGAVYSLPVPGGLGPYRPVAPPAGLLPLRPPVLAPPAGPPSGYLGNGAPPGFRPPVTTQYYGSNAPFSSSNGAPPQYSAQYQSSGGGGGSQEYANGPPPARVPLLSTYNQGPVYQR